MTLVTIGSDDVIEQITKQLNKLVDVVKLLDITESTHVEREMMLIQVRASGPWRDEGSAALRHIPAVAFSM